MGSDHQHPAIRDWPVPILSFWNTMPEAGKYLTAEAIDTLRREIAEHENGEIFAVLERAEGETLFGSVTVVCRGTTTEVPALLSRTQPGHMTVHNHPSGVLRPSTQDMRMATLFGEEGVGSMIVNNDVSRCVVIVEPSEAPAAIPLETSEVTAIFGNEGPLAKKLPAFEARESQTAMASAVTQALNQNQIMVVEAGTGTGKSLAYLIPSMMWAKANRRRIVIATKTIALQEQLIHKDIPLAQKTMIDPPRASLVKGRNNYACLRKIADLRTNQLALFSESERDLKKEIEDLADWVASSGSGDRADLPFVPSGEAWDAIRSDADMCLGSKCPYFQNAPFYESRRRAVQSHILVVNQALLFADLAVRQSSENYKASAVIPAYDHIILDEAHSVEDIATDHFGIKLSSLGLRLTTGKFLSVSRGNRGLLHRLYQLAVSDAPEWANELEEQLIVPYRELQELTLNQLGALNTTLHQTLNQEANPQKVLWLKDSLVQSGILREAQQQAQALLQTLHKLILLVKSIRQGMRDQSEAFREKTEGLIIEIDARLDRLQTNLSALKQFAVKPEQNQIHWLELRRRRDNQEFTYQVSPLDVSQILKDALFTPFKSVIMTSATLSLGDKFKFFSERLGIDRLEDREVRMTAFPSPFDYGKQARVLIPKMNAAPNHPDYLRELTETVLACVASGIPGGTLVLLTSYSSLNQLARKLELPLAELGVELLVQGRGHRHFLAKRLTASQGVLLGTDSFWEGIDLPGLALTKVIIAKLPFRQLGDPIFEARCQAIEETGRSSFNSLSLPIARLKFKQGAGRLIRHRTDTGVLVLADNRIRQKSYGSRFLSLLEDYPVLDIERADLLRQTPPVLD